MDGLKHINDTYGHGEGDFAIISLSKAITRLFGENAVCSRFGGDEFNCVVILGQKDFYTAEGIAKELAVALDQTEGVREKPYPVTASIGLICEKITEGLDIENMLSAADKRMYTNKVARKKERRE